MPDSTKMFFRVSMTVTRVFEVDRCSYSDDGVAPEPSEHILKAELEAVKMDPFEFLENCVANEEAVISSIEVQEVIPCPTN